MMPQRINGGQALVVLGALALVVSLFLHWYEPSRSAWTVFEVWDLVLAAIGIAALGTVVPARRVANRMEPFVPQRWLPMLGVAALIIVVAALINHPPAARDSSLELGAWIGLAGSIVLVAGAVLTTARISLVITLRSPDGTNATAPPPESPDEVFDSETQTQPIPRRGRT
jgi:hypothetical protein